MGKRDLGVSYVGKWCGEETISPKGKVKMLWKVIHFSFEKSEVGLNTGGDTDVWFRRKGVGSCTAAVHGEALSPSVIYASADRLEINT